MKISTKGRYALRMMIDLAHQYNKSEFIALKDIAGRQSISKKYLEQIVSVLTKNGLLKANRGYQGGYMLVKSPKEYTVGDILRFTEGNLAPVSCLENDECNSCSMSESCQTLYIWKGLYKTITEYLDSITLQDIIEQETATGNNYCI